MCPHKPLLRDTPFPSGLKIANRKWKQFPERAGWDPAEFDAADEVQGRALSKIMDRYRKMHGRLKRRNPLGSRKIVKAARKLSAARKRKKRAPRPAAAAAPHRLPRSVYGPISAEAEEKKFEEEDEPIHITDFGPMPVHAPPRKKRKRKKGYALPRYRQRGVGLLQRVGAHLKKHAGKYTAAAAVAASLAHTHAAQKRRGENYAHFKRDLDFFNATK
jgi:hypothetical protein